MHPFEVSVSLRTDCSSLYSFATSLLFEDLLRTGYEAPLHPIISYCLTNPQVM